MQKWCVQLEAAAALALLRCTSKLGAPFCTRTIKDNEDFRPPLQCNQNGLCYCYSASVSTEKWGCNATVRPDQASPLLSRMTDQAKIIPQKIRPFFCSLGHHTTKEKAPDIYCESLRMNHYFQRLKKAILFLYPPDMLLPLLVFALLSAKLLKSCTRVANNHVCFFATNICLCVYGKFFEEPA